MTLAIRAVFLRPRTPQKDQRKNVTILCLVWVTFRLHCDVVVTQKNYPMKTLMTFLVVLGIAASRMDAAENNASRSTPLAGGARVAYVKGMETLPLVLARVAPVYPRDLREKGVQGFAIVDVRVDSTGRVIQAEIVRATLPEFGERALDAAKAWTFEPATAQGRAITSRVRLPFEFTMPQVAALERR